MTAKLCDRDDDTVPLTIEPELGSTEMTTEYPPSTRVISRAWENTCLIGYAVTLDGARRILYELGIHKMDGTTDIEWRSLCHGVDGRMAASCLTVQPQLFQQHRPAGIRRLFSDIDDHGDTFNPHAFSMNIVQSVKAGFEEILARN